MSATSELHHDLAIAETLRHRWTVSEFHALVTEGATAAWQNSGLPLRHVEIYALVECAFRTAFPDRVPSNEGV